MSLNKNLFGPKGLQADPAHVWKVLAKKMKNRKPTNLAYGKQKIFSLLTDCRELVALHHLLGGSDRADKYGV